MRIRCCAFKYRVVCSAYLWVDLNPEWAENPVSPTPGRYSKGEAEGIMPFLLTVNGREGGVIQAELIQFSYNLHNPCRGWGWRTESV